MASITTNASVLLLMLLCLLGFVEFTFQQDRLGFQALDCSIDLIPGLTARHFKSSLDTKGSSLNPLLFITIPRCREWIEAKNIEDPV